MERSENLFPVMSESGHVNRIRGLFFFVPLVNLLDSGYGYMMHILHGLMFLSLIHLDHLTILSKGKFYLCIGY